MSGFSDLVAAAMPYMATMDVAGIAGANWEWGVLVTDNDGAPVDFTGCTGTCVIRERVGGTSIATPTVALDNVGQVTCTVGNTATNNYTPGVYTWELQVTRTSDGKIVKLVGGGDSRFTIKPEVI